MRRLDRWAEVVITAVIVAFLALIALGTPTVPLTCAQGECSCPTVTAQAAVIEHQATVIARLWNDGVGCRATLEAIRATQTTQTSLPYVGAGH